MQRVALVVIAPVVVLTLVALVWLWPSADAVPVPEQAAMTQYAGSVTALEAEECLEGVPDEVNGCGSARVSLTSGSEEGITVALPEGAGAPEVDVGDEVVLIRTSSPDGDVYSIVDHQRSDGLWVLVGAFALALVAFGRWRGFTALGGLGVTFALLLLFVVPAILAGSRPYSWRSSGRTPSCSRFSTSLTVSRSRPPWPCSAPSSP